MPDADPTPTEQPKGLRSYRGGRPKGVRNRRRDEFSDAVMLRVGNAARHFDISETRIKRWIKNNEVVSHKIGNIRLVEVASLKRLIAGGA
jgi:hypothetical protein